MLLASASPRRRELLQRIGIEPEVRPSDVDERIEPGETPVEHAARLAASKAAAAIAEPGVLVIAADTIVVLDDRVLGKPRDRDEAVAMLRSLSGRAHRVLTAVHLRRDRRQVAAVESTTVWFRDLAEAEIERYVDTGEADDKAGAYGIQGRAGIFVDRIDGSDTNVVGLPLARLHHLATGLGVRLT